MESAFLQPLHCPSIPNLWLETDGNESFLRIVRIPFIHWGLLHCDGTASVNEFSRLLRFRSLDRQETKSWPSTNYAIAPASGAGIEQFEPFRCGVRSLGRRGLRVTKMIDCCRPRTSKSQICGHFCEHMVPHAPDSSFWG